jgi:hypothetical protein
VRQFKFSELQRLIFFPTSFVMSTLSFFCQAEASKAREDIEARNTTLHVDLSRSQKSAEDLTRKVASLQSLNDAKTQSIGLLEKDQEHNKAIILDQQIKLRDLVRLLSPPFCYSAAGPVFDGAGTCFRTFCA